MNDRELDLTEAQKAIKSKYPPITKKYECKWNEFTVYSACHVNPVTNTNKTYLKNT